MHLKHPGFTYSVYGPFTKNQERIQRFKQREDSRYIHQNELDKACFQHDMTYGDFKALTRRTASYKILLDKVFNIAENPKYDGYQRGLASMVYICFDKKLLVVILKRRIFSNNELAEELHKPIVRKFNKRKVQSPLIVNIWSADLADMQLISKFHKGCRFLICVIIHGYSFER